MWSFTSDLFAISLISTIVFIKHTAGLSCYQCGSEAIFTDGLISSGQLEAAKLIESCASFEGAFTWSVFVVECGESQICTKATAAGPHRMNTVRGCSDRNNSLGQFHRLGCGRMTSSRIPPSQSDFEFAFSDEICMCDTNYCNSVSVNCSSIIMNLFILIVIIMVNLK